MLKEPHSPHLSRQAEGKLPPIYKVREQQAVNNNFPFSMHDNRHCFQNSGHYLDSGLGRRKISPDKRQHASRNFNLWACDYVPSCLDGVSNNQISYRKELDWPGSTYSSYQADHTGPKLPGSLCTGSPLIMYLQFSLVRLSSSI
ncbi:Testis-Expressed Protein 36 [Manis pentadactyla]|nr:Testis-Expressed Protein 36 [Manis pentadactyla]